MRFLTAARLARQQLASAFGTNLNIVDQRYWVTVVTRSELTKLHIGRCKNLAGCTRSPYAIDGNAKLKKFMKFASFLIAIILICSSIVLWRISTLSAREVHLENFSYTNKIEIYVLGLFMGLVAYPIYPEISHAHLSLYSRSDRSIVQIRDDFFLKSRVIQRAIESSLSTNKASYLAWPASAYVLSLNPEKYWEARVALSLNGGWLSVEDGVVKASIDWRYPRNSLAPLLRLPLVGLVSVQEGLFWVLQEEGWLFPKKVEWNTPIESE